MDLSKFIQLFTNIFPEKGLSTDDEKQVSFIYCRRKQFLLT